MMSTKNAERRDFVERRRCLLIGLFVGALLIAVLVPGRLHLTNRVAWLEPGPGLALRPISQALSEEPLVSTTGEFTVEVFLSPDDVPGRGNQEILSFSDDRRPRLLLLGQFPGGLFLRGRADNPIGEPRDDAYIAIKEVGLEAGERVRHLAVAIDAGGAELIVNGRPTRLELPKTVARSGEPFGGQMILGSSSEGWGHWSGELFGVIIHDRRLTSDELRVHVMNADRAGGPWMLEHDASAIARYDFTEGEGREARSEIQSGPKLVLPDRITRPARWNFLSMETLRSTRNGWGSIDLPLNVIGFLPMGFLIAWKRSPRWVVIGSVCGMALSLGVEMTQSIIPGRSSSGVDLLSNSAGALLGALATRIGSFR